jgi:hypothetical protein
MSLLWQFTGAAVFIIYSGFQSLGTYISFMPIRLRAKKTLSAIANPDRSGYDIFTYVSRVFDASCFP